MDFRTIRIPYSGREKYPSKEGGGNAVSNKKISNYLNNAASIDSSTPASTGDHDRGGVTSEENRGANARSFNVWASKTSGIFNYAELAQLENTDQIVVRAYKDMSNAQVWIGDAEATSADTADYDIVGLPEMGMSATVINNGTTAATIVITVDHSISQDTGELSIPVCININDNPIEPYKAMWNIYTERIVLEHLTYSWTINRSEGTPGASIRGPYDYNTYSGTTRWWCDGTVNSAYSESDRWIDVIVKDGVYYYCNSTYYGTLAPWEDVEDNWTEGESFDFVATNLLLASGAAINFLTNNELYLRDSNNVVTAGARGGDNVNFWAGSSAPSGAPFMVTNDGTLYANKGYFAGFIQYPYMPISALTISNGRYVADTEHPYLVSYPFLSATAARVSGDVSTDHYNYRGTFLDLPAPTSGLNGFTYRILVNDSTSLSNSFAKIFLNNYPDRLITNLIGTRTSPGSTGPAYSGYCLNSGCFTITCAPAGGAESNRDNGQYRWFITDGPQYWIEILTSIPTRYPSVKTIPESEYDITSAATVGTIKVDYNTDSWGFYSSGYVTDWCYVRKIDNNTIGFTASTNTDRTTWYDRRCGITLYGYDGGTRVTSDNINIVQDLPGGA